MEDIVITPDEMKAAGIVRLTPAEMKGREYVQPRSMSQDDQTLGLMSGPIVADTGTFGPKGATSITRNPNGSPLWLTQEPSPFERADALRSNPVSDPMQVDPLLQFGTEGAMATAAGGVIGAPFRALTAGDAAGAARMASSAALHRGPEVAATGAALLPLLAKFLLGGHGSHMMMKAAKLAPAAANVARSGAAPVMAGAGAATEVLPMAMQKDHESPEQRAARILLGQSPNFVER